MHLERDASLFRCDSFDLAKPVQFHLRKSIHLLRLTGLHQLACLQQRHIKHHSTQQRLPSLL